jgi:hypothetical protein
MIFYVDIGVFLGCRVHEVTVGLGGTWVGGAFEALG